MNHVLISSPKESMRNSVKIMLPKGHIVHMASVMEETLEILLAEDIDILVIDLPLGEGNGLKVLKKISRLKNPPTVIATVPSQYIELAREAERSSVYHVLEKPFSQKDFQSVFAKAVDRQDILAEKRHLEKALVGNSVEKPTLERRQGRQEFDSLYKGFSKALTSVFDIKVFLDSIMAILEEELQVERVLILLLDEESRNYSVKAYHGYRGEVVDQLLLSVSHDVIVSFNNRNALVLSGTPLLSDDAFLGASVRKFMQSFRLELLIGLKSRGELVGLLGMGGKLTGKPYSEEEHQMITTLARYLSMAIENSLLYREVSLARKHNENILANIPSGVVTINNEGIITAFNQAAQKILDLSAGDCLGRKMMSVNKDLGGLLLASLRGGKGCHRVEFHCPELGKPLGISATQIKNEKREVVGALMVFTDLTEIKMLERKLEESRRTEFWDQLVRRISHEVKNPLVAIKTFAQLLPEKYEEEEFRNEFYRLVNLEIDRLNDIVEKMTQLTNLKPHCLRRWDINTLLDNVLGELQAELEKHKIKVVKCYNINNPEILVDFDQIQDAFTNIVTNALEVMKGKGTLTITTSDDEWNGDGSVIEIRDNGPGIPAGDEEKLFDPFYTTKAKGFGLGLPIAKRIVEGHRGCIRANRLSPSGVALKIFLPRGTVEDEDAFDTDR